MPALAMRRSATCLVAALLLLTASCDSLIEETEPSTAISQEVALSNPDAVLGIRASMYDWMHTEELSTDWLLGPSALADNTFFRSNQQRHQGLNLNELRAGLGTGAYNELYGLINDANILIGGIEEGVFEEGVANKVRAEAFFMRALALHHLTRIFAYDPDGQGGVVAPASGAGAGFDLGVVIRTAPTLSVLDAEPIARSTVPEVYDQIEQDLEQALRLFEGLPEDVREEDEFYPSEPAVHALMARVDLYERDWAAADQQAQRALDGAADRFGSGLADADALKDIFDESTGNPEAIFTIDTNPGLESVGINEAISAYLSLQWLAQLPTQDLVSLYEEEDARLAAWYAPCFDEVNNTEPGGCAQINDEGLELTKYVSEQALAQFADDYVHLRAAEMVLIQAEARLHTQGPAAAIERLNDLRAARDASALEAAAFDFDAAYEAVLDERRRELVAEGHRFFDLKRLGRDIRKAPGTDRTDVPFNDVRILDDLPPDQLTVNELLVQNPGYAD